LREAHRPTGISKLTLAERQQRGRIGSVKTSGGDVVAARLAYDELKAERELREAAERLVRARVLQGKTRYIDDIPTLSRIAALILPAERMEVATASARRRPSLKGRSEQSAGYARTHRSA